MENLEEQHLSTEENKYFARALNTMAIACDCVGSVVLTASLVIIFILVLQTRGLPTSHDSNSA